MEEQQTVQKIPRDYGYDEPDFPPDDYEPISDFGECYEPEEDYEQYNYCPTCGEEYGDNPKQHKCDVNKAIENHKPRFDVRDINHYNEAFLREIIKWQDLKIQSLTEPDKVNIHNLNYF